MNFQKTIEEFRGYSKLIQEMADEPEMLLDAMTYDLAANMLESMDWDEARAEFAEMLFDSDLS